MNPFADDELASAFLDGELPPDDRARFERQLAERPELRQLVEELRGLRASFEGLPRHRLGPEFAEQVLRRAEREMLSAHRAVDAARGSAAGTPPAADSNARAERVARAWGNGWTWRRLARPLGYVAAAVAAAAAVMVFRPDDPRVQVARDEVLREPRAGVAPPPSAAPADAEADRGAARGAAAAGPSAVEGPPRAELRRTAEQPEPSGLARETPPLSPAPMGKLGPAAAADKSAVEPKRQDADADAAGGVLALIDDPELLVVQLQITPEAARDDFFRRVLLRNRIDASEAAEAAAASTPESGGAVEPLLAQTEAAPPAAGSQAAEAERRKQPRGAVDSPIDSSQVEAYVVVCPAEQLTATLADLQSRRAEVAQVSIVSPGAERQMFRRGASNGAAEGTSKQLAAPQPAEVLQLRQLYAETLPRAVPWGGPAEADSADGLRLAPPDSRPAAAPPTSTPITISPANAAPSAPGLAPALPPVLAGPQPAPAGPPLSTGAAAPGRVAGLDTLEAQSRLLGESRGRAVRYVLPGEGVPAGAAGLPPSPAAAAAPTPWAGGAMGTNRVLAPQAVLPVEKPFSQTASSQAFRRAVFFVQVAPGGSPAAASAPAAPTSPAAAPGSTAPSTPGAPPPEKPSASPPNP